MPRIFCVVTFFFLMLATAATAAESIPFPKAIDQSAVATVSLGNVVNDALILGNGDVNGLLYADGKDLVLRLTKNDVWDARLDSKLDPPLPTLARLKELLHGGWTDREWILPAGSSWTGPDAYQAHAYPCPRAVGMVRLRGAASTDLMAKLDLRRAAASIVASGVQTHATILADRNVVLFESADSIEVDLEAMSSDDLPPSASGRLDDGVQWITQKIPGDPDWPGMQFAVVLAKRGGRTVVAVVTSFESETPLETATALAQGAMEQSTSQLRKAHEAAWTKFWSRSGIDIGDSTLEAVWYRSLYFLRCVSKPGVVSPGLFAGLIDAKPAWHGDYHTNYNIQQTYWSAYSANQCELTEPYDRLITDYLPRARWLAKQVFDSNGAYFPHVLFAYEPSDPTKCKSPGGRQYIHHVWGFSLGVAGFTVQPLWWRYKYQPEEEYLRRVAYPAVRDVAIFQADFIDQCERDGEKVELAPTVSPEHWRWTPGLERNRNCTFDIAMFHYIFDAAIEGATRLKQDAALVERFRQAKTLLPNYPVHTGTPKVVVDVLGAPPIVYNIPVPTTPIFPGDQITAFSPVADQTLFRDTVAGLQHNGNNAPIMLMVCRARLSTTDAYDWTRTELDRRQRPNGTLSFSRLEPPRSFSDLGHYTEMFGAALPITEMLLQSVGDVIRLFPAWPDSMSAKFVNLRTQGGFLVSAKGSKMLVQELTITSTAGERLRLVNPFPQGEMLSGNKESWETIGVAQGDIFDRETVVGEVLRFRPRAAWRRVRSQGTKSSWAHEKDATVMRFVGKANQSNGYRFDGLSVDTTHYPNLEFELRGSANAKYFVVAIAENGQSIARTRWLSSPTEYETARLALPRDQRIVSVVLYTMAKEDGEATNAFRSLAFVGPKGQQKMDLHSQE